MNLVDTEIHAIRPDPLGHRMLGVVSFHFNANSATQRQISRYECSCKIPTGTTSEKRMAQIKSGLLKHAQQQAQQPSRDQTALELIRCKTKSAA